MRQRRGSLLGNLLKLVIGTIGGVLAAYFILRHFAGRG